jgi:putative RecB family exonuclease
VENEPAHRSVSQLESYSDCGLKYRLQRIDHVYEAPAWWNAGGRAFHSTIEIYERLRLQGELLTHDAITHTFVDYFAHEIAVQQEAEEDTTKWRAAKKGTENQLWWLMNGVKMCKDYLDRNGPNRGYEILILDDDKPALELEFLLDVNGVKVKGYVDQVIQHANGDLVVRDLKTGARQPTDTFQLGTYAHAMKRCYGYDVGWGDYWLARKAISSYAITIAKVHPWEQLVYRYTQMDRAEKAGIYLPRVSSFCNGCGMKPSCPIQNPELKIA